jgi:Zn-dependent protease
MRSSIAGLCYKSVNMPSGRQGSVHLFRVLGIDVFLHWSWFLVAAFEIEGRTRGYSSLLFNVLEYLALFVIVLLHEYGHALACRQVGGSANRIVLWPLGGVAFVDPPPRPGANLWSIAAGPLVNVALLPVLSLAYFPGRASSLALTMPDVYGLLRAVWFINLVLLVFNILPVYPLDGGQILRSLLWFVIGRARSLMAATIVGFLGAAGFILLAVWLHSIWLGVISIFMLINCWSGLKHAQALSRLAKLPRRHGFACPRCGAAPPVGGMWTCGACQQPFDTFQTQAVCPHCSTQFAVTRCLDCGGQNPIAQWATAVPAIAALSGM